jgi:hypothetical protein
MTNRESVMENKNITNESTKNSLNALKNALALLQQFQEKTDKRTLLEAANSLIESLKYEKNQVEPYFFLSYIFFILDNNKLALKYLKICELIDPTFPELKKLKGLILGIFV